MSKSSLNSPCIARATSIASRELPTKILGLIVDRSRLSACGSSVVDLTFSLGSSLHDTSVSRESRSCRQIGLIRQLVLRDLAAPWGGRDLGGQIALRAP